MSRDQTFDLYGLRLGNGGTIQLQRGSPAAEDRAPTEEVSDPVAKLMQELVSKSSNTPPSSLRSRPAGGPPAATRIDMRGSQTLSQLAQLASGAAIRISPPSTSAVPAASSASAPVAASSGAGHSNGGGDAIARKPKVLSPAPLAYTQPPQQQQQQQQIQQQQVQQQQVQHQQEKDREKDKLARRHDEDPNGFLTELMGDPVVNNTTALSVRTLAPPPPGGRVIVVGDVHGCLAQLEELVAKVRYNADRDRLVIIGDYVNKGPDSLGVVQACRRWRAVGVLGNHDLTLLSCITRHRRRPFTPDELRDPVKRLAKDFPTDCEGYLRRLPHLLRLPQYNTVLVHAGINVGVPLDRQDPMEVMHLRLLEPAGGGRYHAVVKGERGKAGEAWGALWRGPEFIVYGHDARSGFQSFPHAVGIDTGCVYGDPLTCVVFSAESPTGEFHSVPGLPRGANAVAGLPPPESEVYEQHADLSKLIIRPTPRATGTSLASPSGQSLSAAGGAARAFPSTPLTQPRSPATAAPQQQQQQQQPAVTELVKATLMALAEAGELAALSAVLGLPAYATVVDALLADAATVSSFWVPLTRAVLRAAPARGPAAAAAVEEALGWCDDSGEICSAVQPELRALREAGGAWPTVVPKYLDLLIRK